MLLSQITADPARYQHRDRPFSEETVNGIVREGLDVAKFDPLPLIDAGDGRYIVGGDGHSRVEAVRRLAESGQLPVAWLVDADRGEWDIPHKVVTPDEADRLSFTANLSRDNFSPTEEARIYQRMLDAGMKFEQIARMAHRSETYIRRILPINGLAACIRERIGKSPDAGGVDKTIAIELASLFEQYNIGVQQQQELFQSVLAHSELTLAFVRGLLKRIGGSLRERETQDVLFSIPANVTQAVIDMKGRAQTLRRAIAGLQALLGSSDALESLPDLERWLADRGQAALMQLKYESDSDGAVIGNLCLARAS